MRSKKISLRKHQKVLNYYIRDLEQIVMVKNGKKQIADTRLKYLRRYLEKPKDIQFDVHLLTCFRRLRSDLVHKIFKAETGEKCRLVETSQQRSF